MDISTPGGQQVLYDFVNWRISGHKPVPPIGNVDYWNSRPKLFHVLTAPAFREAAKKIAPLAVGKMSQLDFDLLLGTLEGRANKSLRALLRKQRAENPCDGSEIKPPFPFTESNIKAICDMAKGNQGGKPRINALNRYTPAGRRLLMDFVDCHSTGFYPTVDVGRVEHYNFREEYRNGTSASAFRLQAKKIARDVAQHVPDDEGFAKLLEEAEQEAAQRKKLRLKKKQNRTLQGC
jgi:hypothetical protein